MFRVYDNVNKKWIRKEILLSMDEELMMCEDALFGTNKIRPLSDEKYTWHQSIGVYDKCGKMIYEGDICEIELEGETIHCLVAYVHERASYMFLDYEYSAAYGFYKEINNQIKIVGNVFDNEDLISYKNINKNGQTDDKNV